MSWPLIVLAGHEHEPTAGRLCLGPRVLEAAEELIRAREADAFDGTEIHGEFQRFPAIFTHILGEGVHLAVHRKVGIAGLPYHIRIVVQTALNAKWQRLPLVPMFVTLDPWM